MFQFPIVYLTNISSSLSSGYSRFPVHEPGNPLEFQGLLLIKKVI
jgi:metal transporter CNNM